MSGVVQANSDDYWTKEEHREWADALAESVRRNPPTPLRRSPRRAKHGRLVAALKVSAAELLEEGPHGAD